MTAAEPQASPLVRMERGELKPKVLTLYDQLFDDESKKPKGFWTEFYLLRCNRDYLRQILVDASPELLLSKKAVTQQIFANGVDILLSQTTASDGQTSVDPATIDNSLVILSCFLQAIFAKPFVNFSADIITLLGGLSKIDQLFFNYLDGLAVTIENCPVLSIRVSAVRNLAIAAGGVFQTSLMSHLIRRSMFSCLVDFIETKEAYVYVGDAVSVLGILASYDRHDHSNPYQRRLADFVNADTMSRIVSSSGHAFKITINEYEGPKNAAGKGTSRDGGSWWWPFGTVKVLESGAQPHATLSILLAIYDFILANRMFAKLFVQTSSLENPEPVTSNTVLKADPAASPFALFLAMCQDMYKGATSPRCTAYCRLSLLVIRQLVADIDFTSRVLLADQVVIINKKKYATPYAACMDTLLVYLRHNLKRTIDKTFMLCLNTVLQALAVLRLSKISHTQQLPWQDLWRILYTIMGVLVSDRKASDKGDTQTISEEPKTALKGSDMPLSTDGAEAEKNGAVASTLSLDTSINSSASSISSRSPSTNPTGERKKRKANALHNYSESAICICRIFAMFLLNADILEPEDYDDVIYKMLENKQLFEKLQIIHGDSGAGAVVATALLHYSSALDKASLTDLSEQDVRKVIKNSHDSLALYHLATADPFLTSDTVSSVPDAAVADGAFWTRLTKLIIVDFQSLYT